MSQVKSTQITVNYEPADGGEDCSGILFEVPNIEIVGGDEVEIRLWAGSPATIAPFYLLQGTRAMGAGENVTLPSGAFTETITFADSPTARTKWPVTSLVSIIAITAIPALSAVAGQNITNQFLFNLDVLTHKDGTQFSSALLVTYNVSQKVEINIDFAQTFKFQTEWPIANIVKIEAINEICAIDPLTGEVITWATKGQDVTSKFMKFNGSCIVQLDKIELYGSVKFSYNRVQYYKKWIWIVPTGSEGLYWFFIYKAGIVKNKFSISLPDLTEGIPEPRNIAINVFARTTDAAIPVAMVYIDGMYVGSTNVDGVIYVNGIMQGTHSLKITKPGFIDTDKDTLYNDELRVY